MTDLSTQDALDSNRRAVTQEGKAAHSVVLTREVPEWVQLLPAGTFTGRDGRGPYHVPDPAAVIAASVQQNAMDLPIDYGHALEEAGLSGTGAPAAGWIVEMEARDGEIWGRVSWSTQGRESIEGGSFRFLSPVFYHGKDGTVQWIERAGLTNRPNLNLRSINAQQAGDAPGEEAGVADKTNALAPVATALGLDAAADEAAVLTKCSQATAAQQGLAKVAQSLELPDGATADQVITAIHARSETDPAKFVPRAQHDQVAAQLKTIQAREGQRLVDTAVAEGKLAPAQKDWALSYHARDPEGFATFIGAQPKVIDPSAAAHASDLAPAKTLDADAKAVCASLGISEEDFAKNLVTT